MYLRSINEYLPHGYYTSDRCGRLPSSGLRLVEVGGVMAGRRSLELEEFMAGVADQLDETNETLGHWFTQIQTIFYKVMAEGCRRVFF